MSIYNSAVLAEAEKQRDEARRLYNEAQAEIAVLEAERDTMLLENARLLYELESIEGLAEVD